MSLKKQMQEQCLGTNFITRGGRGALQMVNRSLTKDSSWAPFPAVSEALGISSPPEGREGRGQKASLLLPPPVEGRVKSFPCSVCKVTDHEPTGFVVLWGRKGARHSMRHFCVLTGSPKLKGKKETINPGRAHLAPQS